MKKFILLGLLSISLVSCGLVAGNTVGDRDLKKQVSIEKDCPFENIEITDKHTDRGTGTYKVNACGETYIYKLTGTVFQESK